MADEPKKQGKKGKPHPKSLANLRPNPKYLKRGGKKPRASLTIPELEYCAWRAKGATIVDSARFARIPTPSIYALERRDLVLKTIEEFKAKIKASALDRTQQMRDELAVITVGEICLTLRTMKTHKYRGDEAKVRLLTSNLQAIGLIKPARIEAKATAGAVAVGSTALQVYRSKWFLEKQQKMAAQLEAESTALQNGSDAPTSA